jgi:hypothetical protein
MLEPCIGPGRACRTAPRRCGDNAEPSAGRYVAAGNPEWIKKAGFLSQQRQSSGALPGNSAWRDRTDATPPGDEAASRSDDRNQQTMVTSKRFFCPVTDMNCGGVDKRPQTLMPLDGEVVAAGTATFAFGKPITATKNIRRAVVVVAAQFLAVFVTI